MDSLDLCSWEQNWTFAMRILFNSLESVDSALDFHYTLHMVPLVPNLCNEGLIAN